LGDASVDLRRRGILRVGLAAASLSVISAPTIVASAWAAPKRKPATRRLGLHNLHTGERVDLVYWSDGRYIDGALRQFDRVLRDHRNNEIHAIERPLFDLLSALARKLQTNEPFEVISGYRSPSSNAMLIAEGHGVAEHSLHLRGMAIDVRLPKRRLKALREAAVRMEQGGVGYYPRSNFVHVDVGRVRYW
jgi:uncharacterized protein YcbK (DUF882 family)